MIDRESGRGIPYKIENEQVKDSIRERTFNVKDQDIGRDNLYDTLRNLLGKDKVFRDLGTRCAFMGTNYYGQPLAIPDYVVTPETLEDVRVTLQTANRYRIPVTPVASGTMEPSCTPYAGGIVLDTYTRLNHIHEINYDDGYAVIEPGVTVSMLLKEVH